MDQDMGSEGPTSALANLIAGFESLAFEYVKLSQHHQTLERKLTSVREQYNELVKSYGDQALDSLPLKLSASKQQPAQDQASLTADDCIALRNDESSQKSARTVRAGFKAVDILGRRLETFESPGVKIWAGPGAEFCAVSGTNLPSISESPLEQDFTIEGRPSRLGCPFASMAKKKLSSHAASVLSRYNTRDSTGRSSTPPSSVSRVNGKESYARRESRRASFADPIKAETCGLPDHKQSTEQRESEANGNAEATDAADVGVCPIRFLDQHSPEEVATYFEKHKHELPRSHEVCVRRYQSNEAQIQQLDAKYGNLVSMIQGLGHKHKDMLRSELGLDEEGDEGDRHIVEAASTDKVRNWASAVSMESPDEPPIENTAGQQDEPRQSHFDRPLREVRVGESPSRPWGIHVPAKYTEDELGGEEVEKGRGPVHLPHNTKEIETTNHDGMTSKPAGRCPFGFDQAHVKNESEPKQAQLSLAAEKTDESNQPVFIKSDGRLLHNNHDDLPTTNHSSVPASTQPQMVFSGPVFIGYSAEEAAKILRVSAEQGRSS